jgi:CubicO group peptidase (beta-lactamase class C family)
LLIAATIAAMTHLAQAPTAPAPPASTPAAEPALAAPPLLLDAAQSDPVSLGWMSGSPPPPDKVIRFGDGSFYCFPQLRWSFSNARQLVPTRNVSRGSGASRPLARAERADLDAVRFMPLGGTATMSWGQALPATYTDGVVVLHQGRLVYERYFGALGVDGQHIAQSVTKSFFGTIAALLIAEGRLDEHAQVGALVPELLGSAFGDATLRQLLDMRTGLKYSEDYADPGAEIWAHVRAGNVLPRLPGDQGPASFYDFLRTVRKQGEHGGAFAYKTVNADALGWVIRRLTGQSIGQTLSERIWSRIGAEQDAYFTIDTVGNEFAGGGLNTGLRDLARFGELMRNEGRWGGQPVIPKTVVDDIHRGGDRAAFAQAGEALLPGWSYRNMWWVSHNAHSAYMARGSHGQALYIDPMAEMVIARYGSHPVAVNAANDPVTLPACHALALHLMGTPH